MIEIQLPFPPSLNHYYRHYRGRTLISREGRAFRTRVCSILAARGIRPLSGDLIMHIDVYPPDRRRRDLDNLQKCLWDSLQHGGAYHDDSQIKDFRCRMREMFPPKGKVEVWIEKDEKQQTN